MPESNSAYPQLEPHDGEYAGPAGYRSPSMNELQMLGRSSGPGRGTLIAAVALLAALVGLVGWRLAASSDAPSVPVAAPGSTVGPTTAMASAGAVLETVALQPTDLHNGYALRLVDSGDAVAGQVTLDNCGYHFTTEAHRVARRQYLVMDPNGRVTGVSNEVVAYDTPANAARALRQWHSAALTCPHHAVTSSVQGVPRLAERVIYDRAGTAALPVSENLVTVESATAPRIGTRYMIAVLQVRGNVLDAIWAEQPDRPTTTDLHGAELVATATGHHLAHLP